MYVCKNNKYCMPRRDTAPCGVLQRTQTVRQASPLRQSCYPLRNTLIYIYMYVEIINIACRVGTQRHVGYFSALRPYARRLPSGCPATPHATHSYKNLNI